MCVIVYYSSPRDAGRPDGMGAPGSGGRFDDALPASLEFRDDSKSFNVLFHVV